MGSKLIRISKETTEKLDHIKYPGESYNNCLYRLLASIAESRNSNEPEVSPDWETIGSSLHFKEEHEITWVILKFHDGTSQKRPEVMKTMPMSLYNEWFEKWKLAGGR